MSKITVNTDRGRELFSELECLHLSPAEIENTDAELEREYQASKLAVKQPRTVIENACEIVLQLSTSGAIRFLSPK